MFKHSLSTPARPVFDASTNTKHRPDGSAGRCLNDAVVKGRVVTLNLVKMVVRFEIGTDAIQGDLKQFYVASLFTRVLSLMNYKNKNCIRIGDKS